MGNAHRATSYEIVGVRQHGRSVAVARLWCADCGEALDVPMNNGHKPHLVRAAAGRAGWTFDQHVLAAVRCAACRNRTPAAAHRGQDEPTGDAAVTIKHRTGEDKAVVADKKKAEPVRPATVAEREKMRSFLDGCFDAKLGCYLDGWTDKTVGEHLGLPWAVVAAYREVCFGPIRTNPELEEAKAALARLSGLLNQTQTDLRVLGERIAGIEKALAA